MTTKGVVYVGTIGQGVWRSLDGGEAWERLRDELYSESDIRALAVNPQNPRVLYAGTETGVYRTTNGGDDWTWLRSEMDALAVWSLAVHPTRPETVFAGTRPSAIYRSDDSGETWRKLPVGVETVCPPIHFTRVTTVLIDPTDPRTVWAGVEIDGVYRSVDGGETWTSHKNGLNSMDIHGLTILPGLPKRILATTNAGICVSENNGETWVDLEIDTYFPWRYCRGISQKADGSGTVFIGNGSGPPGDGGSIQLTQDGGRTWHQASLSHEPNSTIWHFATHYVDPNLLFAYAISGQIFRSEDGGYSWIKLKREFGEVRAMAWVNGN